jgi:hypothetical protein
MSDFDFSMIFCCRAGAMMHASGCLWGQVTANGRKKIGKSAPEADLACQSGGKAVECGLQERKL